MFAPIILGSDATILVINSLSLNFLSNKVRLAVSKLTTAVATLSDIWPATSVVSATLYFTVIDGTT